MGGGGEDPQINVQIIRSELGATFSLGQKSGGVGQDGGILYIIDLGFFFLLSPPPPLTAVIFMHVIVAVIIRDLILCG